MKMKNVKIEEMKAAICTALWAAAIGMGIVGTVWFEIRLLFWALIVALVACCMSGYMIVAFATRQACREERLRLEHLARIVLETAEQEKSLARLPRPRG